jgi:hypothetical protein
LSHTCSSSSQTICPGWPQTMILLTIAFQVARITNVSHLHPASRCSLYSMHPPTTTTSQGWCKFLWHVSINPRVLVTLKGAPFKPLCPPPWHSAFLLCTTPSRIMGRLTHELVCPWVSYTKPHLHLTIWVELWLNSWQNHTLRTFC